MLNELVGLVSGVVLIAAYISIMSILVWSSVKSLNLIIEPIINGKNYIKFVKPLHNLIAFGLAAGLNIVGFHYLISDAVGLEWSGPVLVMEILTALLIGGGTKVVHKLYKDTILKKQDSDTQ